MGTEINQEDRVGDLNKNANNKRKIYEKPNSRELTVMLKYDIILLNFSK